jgi:hypothetical protein
MHSANQRDLVSPELSECHRYDMMVSAVLVAVVVAVAVVVDNWWRYGITGKRGGGVQLTMPVKDVEREDGHGRNREIRLLARPTEILTDQSTAVAIHGGVCNLLARVRFYTIVFAIESSTNKHGTHGKKCRGSVCSVT